MLFQDGLGAGNRKVLLSNRNVDTDEVFALLVDDGIDSNGRLTRLAIADDQFALATPNRDHAINSFQTSLHRCIHRLAHNNARSNSLDRAVFVGNDWAPV